MTEDSLKQTTGWLAGSGYRRAAVAHNLLKQFVGLFVGRLTYTMAFPNMVFSPFYFVRYLELPRARIQSGTVVREGKKGN